MEREAVVDRSSTPDGFYIFENRAEIANDKLRERGLLQEPTIITESSIPF
jgi:hypothetical protein